MDVARVLAAMVTAAAGVEERTLWGVLGQCDSSQWVETKRGPCSSSFPHLHASVLIRLSRDLGEIQRAKATRLGTEELAYFKGCRPAGLCSAIHECYRLQINEHAITGRKASVLAHLRAAGLLSLFSPPVTLQCCKAHVIPNWFHKLDKESSLLQ